MNSIDGKTLDKANEAAIYSLYLYLAHKTTPISGQTLRAIVTDLQVAFNTQNNWIEKEINRFRILKNAIERNTFIANSEIGNFTRSIRGLTACSFTNAKGEVFVVFRGTGKGEWIDNGEGLSGVPETNTYITYEQDTNEISRKTVKNDYATEQQVEALNWFNNICGKNRWDESTGICISGHSKGGNKAQFVAINSDLVAECYSFNGQGFSPEAIASFKKQYGANFEIRRQNIYSFATENDFINVLGKQLVPNNQVYYFESSFGLHYLEWMLDKDGRFNRRCEQGELSKYVETLSKDLMRLPPFIREYATLGVMNIFQKFLGKETPVNGDSVSISKTIAGISIAVGALLYRLGDNKGDV